MPAAAPVRTSRSGAKLPALGQGTWEMGVRAGRRADEVRALRLGLDLGLTLIDTAEMYADGGAETVVGEALEGRRDEAFVVSKVLPDHATRKGTVQACERSLKRLGIDALDLYLLHWESRHPLEGTLEAFLALRDAGKIRHFGVSNFDAPELEKAERLPGGKAVAADQVLYNLGRRGIERRLIPWCADRGVVVMAYSPLEQGRLRASGALRTVAARHGATPEQVALAWTFRHPAVVTIVKAASEEHLRADAAALGLRLEAGDLALLDQDHPPPDRDVPLETL